MVKRVRLIRRGGGAGNRVGYGEPPKHTQFKPGQSGNPKGRPKGRKNIKTEVLERLNSTVTVNKNGRVRKISTLRAVLEVLGAKALQTDQRAIEQVLRLAEKYDQPGVETNDSMSSGDQAILDSFARRLKQVHAAGGDDE
ncbi:DUF5681 domain-containing protein [Bradyrhizobium sp. JYMT SZCCT0428]|uniref:DUF5681 domain-containing protein n=1 Tax=Bradyrhizobium sp. JYMT SZCCT0428 TaxID=2807673 RepID=UPI001BAA651C|nr:DUF5681 domain-containing protein [Bradyrhizobium sp. JYMT SZCCT0428]MBR1156001.1 hypothetical protein [Bradyrhizobium sp. JYMT SZCCT0428]